MAGMGNNQSRIESSMISYVREQVDVLQAMQEKIETSLAESLCHECRVVLCKLGGLAEVMLINSFLVIDAVETKQLVFKVACVKKFPTTPPA